MIVEHRGITNGEIERRTIASEATLEYRDDPTTGQKTPVIVGYAAVFRSESRNLGGFVEVLEPRSFDKVLKTNPDVVAVWNHNKDLPLGRVADGRLRLSVDERGLRYEVTPNQNTSIGRDVTTWVADRTVQASSFAFAVNRDVGERWESGPNGLRLRRITEVALLDDVSPVLRPAYDATSVVVSRRALELAAGESHRPNQTMSNAAKRGLKQAAGRSDVDPAAVLLAERIAERQILTVDDVEALSAVVERSLRSKTATWAGTPAWIEFNLAGGDSGQRWIQRRNEEIGGEAGTATVSVPPEDVEERAEGVDLKPTAAMAAACRRGLKLHEDGRSGDGLKPETVARANRIAARETLTPSHVREMRAWFRRHKVDRRPGWDAAGSETPGFTAWMLWGGSPAWRWSEAKVAQMERAKGERADADDADVQAAIAETEAEYRGMGYDYAEYPPKIASLYREMEKCAMEYGEWTKEDEQYMAAKPYCRAGMNCRMVISAVDDDAEKEPDNDMDQSMNPAKRSDENTPAPTSEPTQTPAEPTQQQREDAAVIAAIAAMDAAVLATHLHGDEVTG